MVGLTIENIVVTFPRHGKEPLRVLQGVDFTIESGEVVALVGPSGCGKTTLLRVLAGLTEANDGVIYGANQMAMVFQRPTLLPWRSALDNALVGIECRGRPSPAQRDEAAALLTSIGLGDHLHDWPHQLSEGMQQRINLARALLAGPSVLLLDEPFAALDLLTRRKLQNDTLRLCQSRKITSLLVSHAIEDVVYLADQVVVLSDKPTRVRATRRIHLPHPRGIGPKARLKLMHIVEEIGAFLVDPAAHSGSDG